MRVFLIGSRSLLGAAIKRHLNRLPDVDLEHGDLPAVDLTEPNTMKQEIGDVDWVINAAEYADLEQAELTPEKAYRVNMVGARNVADFCVKRQCRLLHISSDQIFDGQKPSPYTERDIPNPLNIYGSSKLAGEKAVRAVGGSYLLVRTQAVYGWDAPNEPLRMHEQIRAGAAAIQAPDHGLMAPTFSGDIAQAVDRLLRLTHAGVVHVASTGQCTWRQFARALTDRINPEMVIEERPQPNPVVKRPPVCILDNHWYTAWSGEVMPSWEECLDHFLAADPAEKKLS